MADLETPEAFAERLFGLVASDAAAAIRADRAAVRAEALWEAADWLASKVYDVREVTRDCRQEAIALKAAGKDWKDAFNRECLSDARCSGFRDAEEHIRALADEGSKP